MIGHFPFYLVLNAITPKRYNITVYFVVLGVDVSADTIVAAVKEHNPDILGLSALLTTNLEQFPLIVEMLEKEGLRSGVKIVVGGATVTDEFAKGARVDALAKSAVDGVNICKAWV